MGSRDHAIIIGIERYDDPDLGALDGPGEDARSFHQWVTSPQGGDVPPGNVTLVPGDDASLDARIEEIEAAFMNLCRSATNWYRGRRLYIYLAGHGVAQNALETSLWAADGGPKEPERHVPGWHWLGWFLDSAYFDELVLFSDCCRTAGGRWPVRQFPLPPVKRGRPKTVRWFRADAVRYGDIAFEETKEKRTRGRFTAALLRALRRAWNERGEVTASTVKEDLEGSADDELHGQAPFIIIESDLVLSKRNASLTRVWLQVKGEEAPVVEGGPRQRVWAVKPGQGPGQYRVDLPRGLYVATAADAEQFFKVSGDRADLDVSL